MKFGNNDRIEVKRVVNRWVDEDGQKRVQISTELLEGELELGSLIKPKNEDVIKFKIKPYRKQQRLNFGGFFD